MSSSSDWWSRRMGGGQAPARSLSPGERQAPPVQPQQFAPQQPASRPRPMREEGFCPSCGSGNFMAPNGGPHRCFDCNFVPGLNTQNSTTGLSAPSGTPTQSAVQVDSPGYQPTTIIGRA